ncbi:protein high chlorophyll fluorescent 107 isoform X2 [Jatropha curcas]|uniref:protein high chlorophyll fluorescent 107 isoform X2 n=1 Tax=Jatropha curcas TaxID=180498 RepID=UPI0005FAFAA2|nr:protein high chlorophyll fluorescent 107 isoform X2 [Jatropha curcas]
MHLFSPSSAASSSSSKSSFSLFTSSQNPNHKYVNYTSNFSFKIPSKTVTIPCSSKQSSLVLDQRPLSTESSSINRKPVSHTERNTESEKDSVEGLLVVRRPAVEVPGEDSSQNSDNVNDNEKKSSAIIDAGLEDFAKKMPIFEPERVEAGSSSQGKPLAVNLDLALYKVKVLCRSYRYAEAQEILEKCISYWPEDGRPYVAMGKILNKQSKIVEARAVYEKGCQATQGENAYIWQCWAVLENKIGNIRRARELFDAATVADKRHIAAWHGWAVLELKEGNVKKARQLLAKGLKFCGGNEYIYQTLAMLEAKANRFEQARQLFRQATKCNPNSCASWLAWAQLEMQQENNLTATQLFEKAIQASPKNRFAWHVWGVFEANMGNIDLARKLLKIGHTLNPRDPVLLQSLALLEYKHSTANLARLLFRRASELDPKHQPVWIAWGWMEWKEGNISAARELYQRALSINSSSESAARCLQSYITWMTWAQLEEDQGNPVRAEEIRNLYFQQRTEVVDDASWVMGILDIIDPTLDSIKRLLKLDQSPYGKTQEVLSNITGESETSVDVTSRNNTDGNFIKSGTGFDLDSFIQKRLSLDPTKLDIQLQASGNPAPWRVSGRRLWVSEKRKASKYRINTS